MKIYAMSEALDTIVGLRFAGIDGVRIVEGDDPNEILERTARDPEIGIILMTVELQKRCEELVEDIKENWKTPLISVIPDRQGGGQVADTISRYVSEAIGIKL